MPIIQARHSAFWPTKAAGRNSSFLGLAVVISLYLARAILRDEFGRWGKLGAAMIIGGAIGNVVDRLIHGHVVDFLLSIGKTGSTPHLTLPTALSALAQFVGNRRFAAQKNTFKRHKGRLKTEHT